MQDIVSTLVLDVAVRVGGEAGENHWSSLIVSSCVNENRWTVNEILINQPNGGAKGEWAAETYKHALVEVYCLS